MLKYTQVAGLSRISDHGGLLQLSVGTHKPGGVVDLPENGVTRIPVSCISNGSPSVMICHLNSGTCRPVSVSNLQLDIDINELHHHHPTQILSLQGKEKICSLP